MMIYKIKSRISAFIKLFLFELGIFDLFRRKNPRDEAIILRYHSIQDPHKAEYVSPSICVSPKIFERQIKYLAKKYKIISLDEIVGCLKNKTPFPKNAIALTFDDGYVDNYVAFKILRKYDVPATFYIVSGCLGDRKKLWLSELRNLIINSSLPEIFFKVDQKSFYFTLSNQNEREFAIIKLTSFIKSNDLETREKVLETLRDTLCQDGEFGQRVMLNQTELLEMLFSGMNIGGHTRTHANLPNAKPEQAKDEVLECKIELENILGRGRILHFSYPNGGPYKYFNRQIKEYVKKAGFHSATTSENRMLCLEDDPFEIPRIGVPNSLSQLVYLIDGERIVCELKTKLRSIAKNIKRKASKTEI